MHEVQFDAGSTASGVYFFRILPRVASALAGRRELYDALGATTHAMGSSANIADLAEQAGLRVEATRRMGFGVVAALVLRR